MMGSYNNMYVKDEQGSNTSKEEPATASAIPGANRNRSKNNHMANKQAQHIITAGF